MLLQMDNLFSFFELYIVLITYLKFLQQMAYGPPQGRAKYHCVPMNTIENIQNVGPQNQMI